MSEDLFTKIWAHINANRTILFQQRYIGFEAVALGVKIDVIVLERGLVSGVLEEVANLGRHPDMDEIHGVVGELVLAGISVCPVDNLLPHDEERVRYFSCPAEVQGDEAWKDFRLNLTFFNYNKPALTVIPYEMAK